MFLKQHFHGYFIIVQNQFEIIFIFVLFFSHHVDQHLLLGGPDCEFKKEAQASHVTTVLVVEFKNRK
jgi:hypothetical protein